MGIEIKPIRNVFDLKRIHNIQRNTWGYRDAMIIPYTHMISAMHSGGSLLGAFLEDQLITK